MHSLSRRPPGRTEDDPPPPRRDNLHATAQATGMAIKPRRFGRESVGEAAGPASLALTWRGRRVRGLGPGLTSDSADAVRVVLRNDLSAGPQVFWHPPALPV